MEDFYPVMHGATTQIMMLGERFAACGVDVVVITRRISQEHAREEMLRGFQILRVPPAVGLHRAGKFLMVPTTLWALLRQRSRYDLIVVSDLKVLGAVGVLAGLLLGKPCFLRAETRGELNIDDWLAANRGPHPILARLAQMMSPLRNAWLRRAHSFLSICTPMTEEFAGAGVPEHQIVEIANGIDTERFTPVSVGRKAELRRSLSLPDGPLFVYTGRLAEGKGLDWLLKVWKDLTVDHSDAHLVLVGSGQGFGMDIEEWLRSYVRDNGLTSQVTFTGAVDNVHEYLQAADFFILPSEGEALPLSLLEAMACGLPSIATAVGGILDIIEDWSNGLLVPFGNSDRLHAALERLIESEELVRRLAERGRATVLERFNIDVIAGRYLSLFAQTGGRRPAEPVRGR
jgi:glycosyltransferase involved in cell wall biosynthesis